MISRFDRYMLSQLMMVFGFFALVLISIYWVNSAVLLFDRLISDNQSVWVFLELTALSLPNVIRLMLPVAGFAAVLYATQRMAGESELVVMQATGFSPYRLAQPVLSFALIVALLVAILANLLVPLSRTRLNERNAEISDNVSARLLTEGALLHPAPGLTLYIRTISPEGKLTDLFLSDARAASGASTIYTARTAYLSRGATGPLLVMFDGMAQRLEPAPAAAPGRLSVTRFEDFTYDIGALLARQGPRTPSLDERMTPTLFAAAPALLAETGQSLAQVRFTAHDRIAKPLLAAAGVLLGFAAMLQGGFSRFGMGRQMAGASALFILLFLLSNLADKAAASDEALTFLLYLPPLAGTLAAIALLAWQSRPRRAPRPALGGTA